MSNNHYKDQARHYIECGLTVVTLLAQKTDHFQGLVFTAYANDCSVRSHQLGSTPRRDIYVDAVAALAGGMDNEEFKNNVRSKIQLEIDRAQPNEGVSL